MEIKKLAQKGGEKIMDFYFKSWKTMKIEVPVDVPKNKWVVEVDSEGKTVVRGQGSLDVYYLDEVMANNYRMNEAKVIKYEV